jgi:D-hexose-6-phosphate mutarotase
VFPQFGQPLQEMPQHGFARTSHWSFESSKLDLTAASVTFSLSNTPATLALWPHEFKLEYTVTLSDEQLNCTLKVNNVGDSFFTAHTLLHTYLKVPAIEAVRVTGFKDRSFVDKVDNSQVGLDTREVASVEREVDRVMTGSALCPIPPITMDCIHTNKRVTLSVLAAITTSNGVHTPSPHDVVFWNPWIEKAKALADLGDLDYLNFLCLEPGTTSTWVTVEPKNILSLSQTLVSSTF